MKRLNLFIVIISLLASSILLGQLPTVVDNSQWFPPVRSQAVINNCTAFSLVYYLKSSIWNREFNRNPKLESNQFSPDFVWNQNIDPFGHYSGSLDAGNFMTEQGCATIKDFPFNQQTPEIFPSVEVKEKALAYKTKSVFIGTINSGDDSLSIDQQLKFLKDSLAQGNCFTISFPIYNYFFNLSDVNNVYNSYYEMSVDSFAVTHVATIAGYNDTIKTAQGRGAFMVINSNAEVASGTFWLDYNWFFFLKGWSWEYCFLEEDFKSRPELSMKLSITSYLNGIDRLFKNYVIVDMVHFDSAKQLYVDFLDNSLGHLFPNLVRLVEVNGQKPVESKVNVYMPLHSHDGNYDLVTDITKHSSASEFSSASVIVYDPISGVFKGEDQNILYEYARTPTAQIGDSYLKIINNGKKITGRVIGLSDTTVSKQNFVSYYISGIEPETFIESSTCTFKRWLITFNIADTIVVVNNPPVILNRPDTLITYPDSLITYQVEAVDPENDVLQFSVKGDGASIDSTGLFTYLGGQVGSYDVKVMVTDGYNVAVDSFIVRVDKVTGVEDDFNVPTEFSLSQNYPNPFNPSTVIDFSIPQSSRVLLKVFNLLGQEVATLIDEELTVGSHSINFDAGRLATGVYIYTLEAGKFHDIKKMLLVK